VVRRQSFPSEKFCFRLFQCMTKRTTADNVAILT
jgi:hypothetical protein